MYRASSAGVGVLRPGMDAEFPCPLLMESGLFTLPTCLPTPKFHRTSVPRVFIQVSSLYMVD